MNGISTVVTVVISTILFFISAAPAEAGLKSGKVSTGLTNPTNVASPFVNGTSKGTFSFKGTKASIKAKGTTLPDTDGAHCTADDIICLVKVTATLASGSPMDLVVVMMAEASGGKVTASHDLCKQRDVGVLPESYFFCPEFFSIASPIAVSGIDAVCYAPDPTWVAAHVPSLPMTLSGHSCEGVILPAPTTYPSTVLFSSGNTIVVP